MALYRGDEAKFAFELKAEGFSMEDDDFEVEIVGLRGGSIKGYKTPPAGSEDTDVIIYSETEETQIPPEEEGGEPTVETTTTWFCIFKTEKLTAGDLKVVTTAYVPDAHADDGIRTQSAVASYPDRLLEK